MKFKPERDRVRFRRTENKLFLPERWPERILLLRIPEIVPTSWPPRNVYPVDPLFESYYKLKIIWSQILRLLIIQRWQRCNNKKICKWIWFKIDTKSKHNQMIICYNFTYFLEVGLQKSHWFGAGSETRVQKVSWILKVWFRSCHNVHRSPQTLGLRPDFQKKNITVSAT